MKILVTGGLGFIGHYVVHDFEQLGHQVAVVDNQTTQDHASTHWLKIVHARRQHITSPIYHCDISDVGGMTTVFAQVRPDLVIHLASTPRQQSVDQDPQAAAKTMIQGLINVLEISQQYQVQRFVFVSSSMVYGDFHNPAKETEVCRPMGQYGIMKMAGELLVKDYARRTGFDHVILRPSAVYGARDHWDRVIAKFLLNAMRDEPITVRGIHERLDFTHVGDTARGIVDAALSDNTSNKVYNITHGQSRSLLEAAEIVIQVVGQGRIHVAERNAKYPRRGSLDISAAARDFGFDPTVHLEEGIQNYYHWLKDSFFWTP